jgi:hypothetical protein
MDATKPTTGSSQVMGKGEGFVGRKNASDIKSKMQPEARPSSRLWRDARGRQTVNNARKASMDKVERLIEANEIVGPIPVAMEMSTVMSVNKPPATAVWFASAAVARKGCAVTLEARGVTGDIHGTKEAVGVEALIGVREFEVHTDGGMGGGKNRIEMARTK